MVKPGLIIILLLSTVPAALPGAAQVPADSLPALPEAVFEEVDARGDATALAELLADLAAHPLDLNEADAEELAQLPALGPAHARAIVRHRTEQGLFVSVSALSAVPGLSETLIHDIAPYVTVRTPEAAKPSMLGGLRVEGLHRIGRRLDVGRGYDDAEAGYSGSPYRLYTRLRLRTARLRAGITAEKDPGEAFAWAPATRTYGFDHVAGYLALYDLGPFTTLLLGDYVATVGQGLILWRGTAFGKSRAPVRPLLRAGRGLRPYASTDENRFFRGLAATVRVRRGVQASVFASRRRLDARLLAPDTSRAGVFSDQLEAASLAQSGLHRTATERLQKDAVRESLIGGFLGLDFGQVDAGLAGYHSRFEPPFRAGSAPHERYRFDQARTTMLSAYGTADLGSAYLFGEAARAATGAVAGLGGLLLRIPPGAEVLLLARHYPALFVSLHGYGFGERNGATENEHGVYAGLHLPLGPRWDLAAYYDLYHFPWVRFGVPRPSGGYEARLVVEHRPRRWLTAYVQGRSETREDGFARPDATGRLLDGLRLETRQSVRFHVTYLFGERLRLQARLEAVRFAAEAITDAYGVLLYQDVRWHPAPRLRLDARLTFFDTDGFETRVFAYENDLRYSFALPALAGRGQRTYLLLRWDLAPSLSLEAKASLTHFEDVFEVGSGLDAVPGTRIREIRAQIFWRL